MHCIVAQAEITAEEISRGMSIAAVGLLIVFTALLLITLFIASLPRVLGSLAKIWPEVEEAHARPSHPESQVPDDARVLAAIGFVLHTEFQKQLTLENKTSKKD